MLALLQQFVIVIAIIIVDISIVSSSGNSSNTVVGLQDDLKNEQ